MLIKKIFRTKLDINYYINLLKFSKIKIEIYIQIIISISQNSVKNHYTKFLKFKIWLKLRNIIIILIF